jgi:putative zinc finger protein
MDHETAVKLMASERYLLRELSPDQRDEFEEHFFDCQECAEDVRAAAAFRANAKAVFEHELEPSGAGGVTAPQPAPTESGWRRWFFTPAFALSVVCNFILLIGFGYLRLRTVPELRQEVASVTAPESGPLIVVPPAARGEGNPIAVSSGKRFLQFRFELSPAETFQSYSYEILDAPGATRLADSISAPTDPQAGLYLTVPTTGLKPGEYLLVLRGVGPKGSSEISTTRFTIQR